MNIVTNKIQGVGEMMNNLSSKFTNDNIDKSPSTFISPYLVNLDIYGSKIKTTSSNDGYYNISYDKSSSDYDVFYKNKTKYRTSGFKITELYFLPLIHNNITNVTDNTGLSDLIGEFAIKLVNGENVDCPLYLFYLVQSVTANKGTDDTDGQSTGSLSKIFDTIIKKDGGINYSPTSTTLTTSPGTNGTIPNQDGTGCIMYINNLPSDKFEINCIFLNPITTSNTSLINYFKTLNRNSDNVNTNFKNFPSGGIKDILTSSILKPGQSTAAESESSAPGYDPNSQIYIDCSPTGASEETIASYNIPINSSMFKDIQNSSLSTLCANFILFGFIVAASYIGIPSIYNLAVLDKKNLSVENRKTMIIYSKPAIILYFLTFSIVLFITGNSTENISELLAGFLLIFLSIITYILLSVKEADSGYQPGSPFSSQFFAFLFNIFAYIFKSGKTILFLWIIFLLIILIIWGVGAKNNKGEKLIDDGLLWRLSVYLGIFIIPFFVGLLSWISE